MGTLLTYFFVKEKLRVLIKLLAPCWHKRKNQPSKNLNNKCLNDWFSGEYRIRTDDLLAASQAL
jgi:hypothetical protein